MGRVDSSIIESMTLSQRVVSAELRLARIAVWREVALRRTTAISGAIALSTGQKIESLEKPVDMEFQIEKGVALCR
jgi:hypothetical protein